MSLKPRFAGMKASSISSSVRGRLRHRAKRAGPRPLTRRAAVARDDDDDDDDDDEEEDASHRWLSSAG